MMRRSLRLFRQTALSPYAAALKHVAIRGKGALELSARDQERMMYLKGHLPADYKPPVQGKWDDTIERWAYAWQYPQDELQSESRSEEICQLTEMRFLIDVAQRLLNTPPSKEAPSAESTIWPALGLSLHVDPIEERQAENVEQVDQQGDNEPTKLLESTTELLAELQGGGEASQEGAKELENQVDVPSTASIGVDLTAVTEDAYSMVDETIALTTSRDSQQETITAEAFAKALDVPVAYVDDGTELAAASKALGLVLIEKLGLSYDNRGISTAVAALCRRGRVDLAEVVIRFVTKIGFEHNVILYTALLYGFANRADVNKCMAIIEEMKENGVTPDRVAWQGLMKAFYKARDYQAVIQVIDNMKAYANIEPDETTFLVHFNALHRDSQRESSPYEAIQLFDQMESVYGFLPDRKLYEAYLMCLCTTSRPDLVQRLRETAKKMEMLGILWTSRTYNIIMRCAAVNADIDWLKQLFAKMRDDRIEVRIDHLTNAIHGHANSIQPSHCNYFGLKEQGKSPVPIWLDGAATCFGLHDLVLQRQWRITAPFLDALLRFSAQLVIQCVEQAPGESSILEKFVAQTETLWSKTYEECHITKTVQSYQNYISMLGALLRVDEAESVFQELVLHRDLVPTRTTYEMLMHMHIRSGEEGGITRALHYMEAMERAGMPLKHGLMRRFSDVVEQSSYRRDMKRRARRIMQAREEYMARKEENERSYAQEDIRPFDPSDYQQKDAARSGKEGSKGEITLTPLPLTSASTIAWWEKWKRETINKHELFETEQEDGMPRGELFEEKNEALRKMGIETKFPTKESLPDPSKHRILPKIRQEAGSEPAGALWALDGGDLAYPKEGIHPQGWGTTLYRERRVLAKEIKKVHDGKVDPPAFSPEGNAFRTAPEELAIEQSDAKDIRELSDFQKYPDHVYDDGTPKPKSEVAIAPSQASELVWQKEVKGPLSVFMTDDELASLDDESIMKKELRAEAAGKTQQAMNALQNKEEEDTEIVGENFAKRRGKYDYLQKWREMYQHGELEAPSVPVVRFGRSPDDHAETLARTVKDWYARNNRIPPSEEQLGAWKEQKERAVDYRRSKASVASYQQRRGKKKE